MKWFEISLLFHCDTQEEAKTYCDRVCDFVFRGGDPLGGPGVCMKEVTFEIEGLS